MDKYPVKWYLRTSVLIVAFLCVGPLALPLLWINPRFSQKTKIVLTAIVLTISYFLWIGMAQCVKILGEYYKLMY